MDKSGYAKISLESIVQHSSVGGVQNFIISDKGMDIKDSSFSIFDSSFDLKYPHIFEGIAVAICTKGRARIKINLQEYDIEANSIIIVLPNSIGQIVEQYEDINIEFLAFSFDFISNIKLIAEIDFLEIVPQITYLKLDKDVISDIVNFHSFIVSQYKSTNYSVMVVKSLLEALMYKLLFILQKSNSARKENTKVLTYKEDIFQQFLKLLFEHHRQERSINFYASKLHFTPKHFAKIIKETSSRSASEWIDEMIIMTIKALLKSSSQTISQVSDELNFANPSTFGTYFKKHTGITPKQYRESE